MMTTTLSGTASCNGIQIYYETFGKRENPPILLIMGLGAQCIMFTDEFIKPLVDANYYVVRFDNRDIGLSNWMNDSWRVDKPYSLADMAKDTLGLLDFLKIEKTHVIGVSMGGMIAQEFTLAYPKRVLTLTSIMSTGDKLSPSAGLLIQPPTGNSDKERVEDFVKIYKGLAGKRFKYDEDEFRELFTQAIVIRKGQNPQATLHQICAIAASGSRLEKLPSIKVPTLILHGTEDRLIPLTPANTYAPLIPGAKMVWMVGVGHELPNGILPQVHKELFELF